ncbi:MAG: putative lipopolysaccharide transport protein LptA [Pseudomonadota bacterium]|jgi:lipopolysaccharide export system protein LptA
MTRTAPSDRTPSLLACVWAAALLGGAVPAPALAERADRQQPMVIEADREGTIDTQRGVTVFSGNALISQGTLLIRAERIEVRDPSGGPRTALALGAPGQLASFRQKRDGVDEHVQAQAERIEYDGGTETLRFIGQAALRRLRGGVVVDETLGARITWNSRTETLAVEGGAPSAANPSGRVRAIFSPAPAASSPPAAPRAEPLPLKPARTLGDPKK